MLLSLMRRSISAFNVGMPFLYSISSIIDVLLAMKEITLKKTSMCAKDTRFDINLSTFGLILTYFCVFSVL